MAAGHGTWAGLGGGVIAAGAFPGGFGVYEVVGSGRGPWVNVWFDIGAAIWTLGVLILIATAGHFVREWSQNRRGRAPARSVERVGIRQTGGTAHHENPVISGVDIAVEHIDGEITTKGLVIGDEQAKPVKSRRGKSKSKKEGEKRGTSTTTD